VSRSPGNNRPAGIGRASDDRAFLARVQETRPLVRPTPLVAGPISTLSADAMRAVMAAVQEALTPKPEEAQDAAFSDSEIAAVVSGARRKGIAMRQIKRVDGPYQNGPKWRLRIVMMNGERRYHPDQYETKQGAARARGALLLGIRRESGPKVGELIEEYRTFLAVEAGNQPVSVETTIARLKGFFAGAMEETLLGITAKRAAELKAAHDVRPAWQRPAGPPISRETRRGVLAETKTFVRWAAQKGCADRQAFEGLKLDSTRGKKVRRSRGKRKLRDHERLRWWAKAIELAREGDEGALALMMCLDGNLRSGEVLHRAVRDVEQGGRRLVIEWGKTKDSDRTVNFGPEVAELLARHIAGREASEPLIRARARGGAPTDRKGWLCGQCIRICRLAEVPRVTPHGLRGSGAEATMMRMVMGIVQATMGHRPGTSVTKDHYLGSEAYAEAERLLARATVAASWV
jgi:integrase